MFRSAMPAGLLPITLAGVLWGTTGVVVQLLRQLTGLSPVSIGFYRLAIAAVVLVLLLRWRRRLCLVFAAVRSAPVSMTLIGCGLGAYQALYFVAVALGGVAMATVVSLGLAPVLVVAWEAVRSRRLPGRQALASLVAAVLGLTLMTGVGATGERPLLGILAAAGSGFGYAVTTVLSRRVSDRVEPLVLTTVSTGIGALALLPLALMGGGLMFPLRLPTAAMLLYLGVITTALAYALFYAGLRTIPGSAAVVLTLFEPLTAGILATVLLGEAISLPALGGGVLLLGAVALTHRCADTAVPTAS